MNRNIINSQSWINDKDEKTEMSIRKNFRETGIDIHPVFEPGCPIAPMVHIFIFLRRKNKVLRHPGAEKTANAL